MYGGCHHREQPRKSLSRRMWCKDECCRGSSMLRVRLCGSSSCGPLPSWQHWSVTVALTSASNITANTTQLLPCQQQPVTACQQRPVTISFIEGINLPFQAWLVAQTLFINLPDCPSIPSTQRHYRASITEPGPGQIPGTGRPGACK